MPHAENLAAARPRHLDVLHEETARALNAFGLSAREPPYGAVGNDTADDTAELQALISDAPASGTIVIPPLPTGPAVYRTSASLNIAKPLRVIMHGATIKNVGSGHVFDISGTSKVRLEGGTLDGNYPTRTAGRGVNWTNVTDSHMQEVRIQNIGDIMCALRGVKRMWVVANQFENGRVGAIRLGEPTTADIEDVWLEDNWLKTVNVSNSQGQAAIQSHAQSGGTTSSVPAFAIRRVHINRNNLTDFTRVGLGLDWLTDSEIQGNEVYGSHNGEACALTGCRNKVRGNTFNDSTGAAGFLLWSWAQAEQDNHDTIVADNIMAAVLAGAGANQGIAIVAAEAGVTQRRLHLHDNRCVGWAVGIQNYLGSGVNSLADDGTVYIRDNHLVGNTGSAYAWASPFTPVLRGNLTAADTVDA